MTHYIRLVTTILLLFIATICNGNDSLKNANCILIYKFGIVDNTLFPAAILSSSYPYSDDSAFIKYLFFPERIDDKIFNKLIESIALLESDEYGRVEDGLGYTIKVLHSDSVIATKYLTKVPKRNSFFQNWAVLLKNDVTELRTELEQIFWLTSESYTPPKPYKKRRK